MTYRFVVYDLEKSLKKTFDDADITFVQILYWVQVVVNKLRLQQNKITSTDLFTSTYSNVQVKKDSKGRKYIDLPTQIMDLQYNGGIVFVAYELEDCECSPPSFAQVPFSETSISRSFHLYLDEYTKPSSKNPFYYRIGDKVDGVSVNRLYLLGLECVDVETLEIGLKGTLDPRSVCNLDEEIPLPDELVLDLIKEVLSLGRYVMLIPDETINQGSDDSSNRVPAMPQQAESVQPTNEE